MERTVEEQGSALDLQALDRWLDVHGMGAGPTVAVSALTGGTQHLMVAFDRGPERFVLREVATPRPGAAAPREAVILAGLAGTGVPHPRLRGWERDPGVLGFSFVVTDFVAGANVARGDTPVDGTDRSYWGGLGASVATALGRLGELTPEDAGLAGFGRPDGFLERQVQRWLWQLDGYRQHEGYPGADLPHTREIARWLEANRPPDQRPGVLHGDLHLANVLFAQDRPEVLAFVDWELCTVGDPLVDLGQVLVTWPDHLTGSVLGDFIAIDPSVGPLPATEIVDAYRAVCSRDLSDLVWYQVLAAFRLGAILEGSHARGLAGEVEWSIAELLHGSARRLFERAYALTREA